MLHLIQYLQGYFDEDEPNILTINWAKAFKIDEGKYVLYKMFTLNLEFHFHYSNICVFYRFWIIFCKMLFGGVSLLRGNRIGAQNDHGYVNSLV